MTAALDVVAATPRAAHYRLLEGAFALTVGFLLFGDYLALSASRLATGEAGNWILATAGLQLAALGAAWWLGYLRGVFVGAECSWFAAAGVLVLGHLLVAEIDGDPLSEYGAEKVAAYFGVAGPALLLGIAVGRLRDWLRWPTIALWQAPLVLACAGALVVDPAHLTIAYHWRLEVYFGVLVLPAHQGLAFALAKGAIGFAALACASRGRHRRILLVVAGGLAGLVVLSGARGYLLALAGALAVIWAGGGRRLGVVSATTLVAWVLYQSSSIPDLEERLDPTTWLGSVAWRERNEAWVVAIDGFLEAPLCGLGPAGFANAYAWGSRSYPHNVFLEYAAELGLLGVAAFVALVVAALRGVATRRAGAGDGSSLFAIGFCAFALLGALCVGDLIRNHFLYFALGLVAGCRQRA